MKIKDKQLSFLIFTTYLCFLTMLTSEKNFTILNYIQRWSYLSLNTALK